MPECMCDPDVWGPGGLERGTGHNPACPNAASPTHRFTEKLAAALHAEQANREVGCGDPESSTDDHMQWHQEQVDRILRWIAARDPYEVRLELDMAMLAATDPEWELDR